MENQIYIEIINLIDSSSMKEHLFANQANIPLRSYAQLIARALIGVDRKRELLVRLEKAAQDALVKGEITQKDWEQAEIVEHIELLDEAMRKLDSLASNQLILIAQEYYYNDSGKKEKGFSFPAVSYQAAKHTIQEYNGEEDLKPGEIPLSYWELYLCHIREDGSSHDFSFSYTCSWDGEIQYFVEDFEERFEVTGKLVFPKFDKNAVFITTPYQPGDILYIDCRPYERPTYCLIIQSTNKAGKPVSNPECLRVSDEKIWISDLEIGGGHYVSSLYRVEKYEGELPPEYALLKPLSQLLKDDPALVEAILKAGRYFDISPQKWWHRFGYLNRNQKNVRC